MLVLSRKRREAIVIDEKIWVYIVELDTNRVKLGIVAPPEMHIRRDELPPMPKPPTQENSQHAN